LAAGLAGGFVGGTVSGAIDGGAKGAIIGGIVGAATGLITAGVAWGVSALGGLIGGYLGQEIATQILATVALGAAVIYGSYSVANGNWDFIAGFAAGMVGAAVGTYIGNRIMMQGVYKNINSSPRVKQTQREVQSRLNNEANFENVRYHVEKVPSPDHNAFQDNGHITFNEPT
jgi:hypothetical protein